MYELHDIVEMKKTHPVALIAGRSFAWGWTSRSNAPAANV